MSTPGAVTYQVTAVNDDMQFNPQNNAVPGKKVDFSTSIGYEGTVFVPDSVFGDIAAVKLAVESQVKLVAAAQALTGTVGG